MTWTYSGIPATSGKDTVRFLVGDTELVDQLVTDEEIAWALLQFNNVFLAAALVCRSIAARFARDVDCRVGDLSTSSSQKHDAYTRRAEALEEQSKTYASLRAGMFVGGLSISDKTSFKSDTDLVQPTFYMGMDDFPS